MDLHQLNIFSEVYRLRSFTRAAAVLRMSQPTISEQIKNLEKELSCRLFDRLGRSIIPTPSAELLFPRAQRLIDDANSLQEDLVRTREEIAGEILIGASTIPGTYIIPRMIVDFRRIHPEVTFKVVIDDTSRIARMILDHEIFCGLVGACDNSNRLTYTTLLHDELILVGSPGVFPGREIKPEQLADLPFLFREEGSGTRKIMSEHFAARAIRLSNLDAVATLGSTASVKEAACQGIGLTVLSRLAVTRELESGVLHEITVRGLTMRRDFYLVRHSQRTLPPQYQTFCSYLENTRH